MTKNKITYLLERIGAALNAKLNEWSRVEAVLSELAMALTLELGKPPPEIVDGSEIRGKTMEEIEIMAIKYSLQLTNDNREEAAKLLGMSERSIYRKLKIYKIIEK